MKIFQPFTGNKSPIVSALAVTAVSQNQRDRTPLATAAWTDHGLSRREERSMVRARSRPIEREGGSDGRRYFLSIKKRSVSGASVSDTLTVSLLRPS